jgi:dolichyl-phosphooligosaccharide-protein glycotransferase
MDFPHYIAFSSPDIWYNFRQIELMIHNFPGYAWFDPMTAYPTGKSIDWGPLLPFLSSSLPLITGMTERSEMMYISSWVTPIFGALMVPLTYFIGKLLWDKKTGVVAAVLISVTSGIYFVTSSFGYVDHHALETFFGALFCLLYLLTLLFCNENSPSVKNQRTLIIFFIFSMITACVYFAGFLNMPTMLLFGLIVAIYTLLQFSWDTLQNKLNNNLVLTNIAVFSPVFFLMVIFGIKQPGFSPQQYSISQLLFILLIIGETLVLYILSKRFSGNKKNYLLSIVACGATLFLLIYSLNRETFSLLSILFGQSDELATITETQPWTLPLAISTLNFTLILAIAGFGILTYHLYTKKRPEHLFLLTWSVIIFTLTFQHLRFEYYFALNIVLLSSLCIITALEIGLTNMGDNNHTDKKIQGIKTISETPAKNLNRVVKSQKKSNLSRKLDNKQVFGAVLVTLTLGITLFSIGLSIQNDLKYSSTSTLMINNNWVETAEWFGNQTTDPGVDYFKIYPKETFEYPSSAYGILSWWDYGHYITFISKRIPVTNPFQDHVSGPYGAAAFYMAPSETDATGILKKMGARYVITDTSLATDKFEPLITWNNSSSDIDKYMKSYFAMNPNSGNQLFQFNGKFGLYFNTMIVRLHNFDGSMQIPEKITYFEYYGQNRNGRLYPIVTTAESLNITEAEMAMTQFGKQYQGNSQAILVGQFLQPIERVPALQHFRLVHESQGTSPDVILHDDSGVKKLNNIKVFEFVQGAHIKGEGIIQLQLITNTERTFTYKQESVNGEFVVPYSTINNPYDIKTVGKYQINGTDASFDVYEEDIIKGRDVNT